MRRLWQILGLTAVIAVIGGGFALVTAFRSPKQPIAFNHRVHVEEIGAACTDCHLYAVNGARATIPNIEVCSDCHGEPQTESAEEARVVEYIERGEVIPWQKIYVVPEHVFFSHRRHTAIGGLECERCHGAVGSLERPVARPAVDLSMDSCMECHEESGVSNDCLLCHF